LETHTEKKKPLTVWMDGDCGLCQMSRAWCEFRDRDGRVRFIDFRAAGGNELPLTHEEHQKSMWVRDGNGALLEGFAAWRRIMAEIPGWRWLARLTSLPPFSLVGPPLYRLVAANRRIAR
jgi:predicted DCC family thiol-disulfide oxidoreductase YuxK